MTSATSYHFSKETPLLWAAETLFCFVFFYVFLASLLNQTHAAAINHAAVYAITFSATALAVGIYRTEIRWQRRLLFGRTIVAAILSLPTVWLIGYVVPIDLHGVFNFPAHWAIEAVLCWGLLIVAMRVALGLVLQFNLLDQRVVVLGASPATGWIRSAGGGVSGLQLMQQPLHGTADQASGWTRISALVVDDVAAAELAPEIRSICASRHIPIMRDSVFLERCLYRLDVGASSTAQDAIHPDRRRPLFDAATRAFDIACAAGLVVMTLPVMLMSAMAIKLEDGGPILYRQQRVGLHGREFTVLKFRSMRLDAEAAGPVWAQQRDPRITGIGSLLRRTHVDELPQIINILRGDMSIIGPRPERLHFVRELEAVIPGYTERAQVKPGLTGWAQVNYPYGATVEDAKAKLSYDMYYVKHRGVVLNLMTLFATVRVVLFQEGSR